MNVLHLTLSLDPGGRREAIRTLLVGHRRDNIQSFVSCLEHFGCDEGFLEREFSGHLALERRRVVDVSCIQRLVAFCKKNQVDVVHTHDAASQLYATIARIFHPSLKVLMTFHRSLGFESERPRDRLRNAVAGMACHAIVVGSVERRQHFLSENHIPASKVIRIPFGVDTGRFSPDSTSRRRIRNEMRWGDSTLVFGAVGHFGMEKGIDLVIRAVQQLLHCNPQLDCHLIVLGDGAPHDRQRVQQLVRAVPWPDRITLLGHRSDMPQWFNAMDVLVHSPRKEAFGLVVAEAMATGVPVVATRTGGVPDMVRDEETGLLTNACLIPLVNALARISRDPGLRFRLASEAYRVALSEFRAELYSTRYAALYRHLTAGKRIQSFDPFVIQCGPQGDVYLCGMNSSSSPRPAEYVQGRTKSCLHK